RQLALVVRLHARDPLFDVPQGSKVLVDLAPVRRAEGSGEPLGLVHDVIQHALPVLTEPRSHLRIRVRIKASIQPLEHHAGVGFRSEERRVGKESGWWWAVRGWIDTG